MNAGKINGELQRYDAQFNALRSEADGVLTSLRLADSFVDIIGVMGVDHSPVSKSNGHSGVHCVVESYERFHASAGRLLERIAEFRRDAPANLVEINAAYLDRVEREFYEFL